MKEPDDNPKNLSLLTESRYSQKITETYSSPATPKQKSYYDTADINQLINQPINLKKVLEIGEELIEGVFTCIDGNKWSPLLMVEANGKRVAAIMYDKHKDEFVEGLTAVSVIYKPADYKTEEILRRFKCK